MQKSQSLRIGHWTRKIRKFYANCPEQLGDFISTNENVEMLDSWNSGKRFRMKKPSESWWNKKDNYTFCSISLLQAGCVIFANLKLFSFRLGWRERCHRWQICLTKISWKWALSSYILDYNNLQPLILLILFSVKGGSYARSVVDLSE